MIDIFSLTTNKLVEKLKEGEISSSEVCTQYVDRIKNFEKDVGAWAYFNKKELDNRYKFDDSMAYLSYEYTKKLPAGIKIFRCTSCFI